MTLDELITNTEKKLKEKDYKLIDSVHIANRTINTYGWHWGNDGVEEDRPDIIVVYYVPYLNSRTPGVQANLSVYVESELLRDMFY